MLRRVLYAGLAAAMLVTLSGCGDEKAPGAEGSSDGTVRELTAANFGTSMASAQASARSAHLTGTVTSAGQTFTMSGDVGVGRSIDTMQMSRSMKLGPGKSIAMRMVDRAFYLKASQGAMTDNPAKPWVKVDLDDPSNPFGAMLDQMLSNFEPDKVQQLYSAITSLNDLGVDDVNGVSARHYSVTVDTDRMLEVMDFEVPGVSQEELKQSLPDEVTSQVWLDSENRPVKTTGKTGAGETEMYFTDWGKKVSITAPPADQVLPFSQVSR
jgi:hypothetical protein